MIYHDVLSRLADKAGLHKEWVVDNPEIEKFVLSVIKECIEIIDDEGGGEGGCCRSISRIVETFGINND